MVEMNGGGGAPSSSSDVSSYAQRDGSADSDVEIIPMDQYNAQLEEVSRMSTSVSSATVMVEMNGGGGAPSSSSDVSSYAQRDGSADSDVEIIPMDQYNAQLEEVSRMSTSVSSATVMVEMNGGGGAPSSSSDVSSYAQRDGSADSDVEIIPMDQYNAQLEEVSRMSTSVSSATVMVEMNGGGGAPSSSSDVSSYAQRDGSADSDVEIIPMDQYNAQLEEVSRMTTSVSSATVMVEMNGGGGAPSSSSDVSSHAQRDGSADSDVEIIPMDQYNAQLEEVSRMSTSVSSATVMVEMNGGGGAPSSSSDVSSHAQRDGSADSDVEIIPMDQYNAQLEEVSRMSTSVSSATVMVEMNGGGGAPSSSSDVSSHAQRDGSADSDVEIISMDQYNAQLEEVSRMSTSVSSATVMVEMNGGGGAPSSSSDVSSHPPRKGSADSDVETIPMDQYNAQLEERKLTCSILWLISKVYEGNVPDLLQNPFFRDNQNVLHLRPQTLYALNNAELYCAAAARIFHDNSFLNQNHSSVIQAMLRCGIDVLDQDGTRVTETMLGQDSPPKLSSHIAMIDALLTAHVRQIITVDRAVQAVEHHTAVDAREEPLDCEDAVLFWVNKICGAVRDHVEKMSPTKRPDQLPVIPEMEDLYEDMCDGACLATLVAFYRPQHLKLKDICFNDQMGFADCVYNLGLVKSVCERRAALPWNVFHFRLEDMLYMHEYLQKNVLGFLADLFLVFEGPPAADHASAGGSDRSDICFNDQMGFADCVYNLGLVKSVCERRAALPWNVFHFRLEDMLYMHEYLQKNVLGFLADLFLVFEGSPAADHASAGGSDRSATDARSPTSSQTRRFEPIAPIPNLRNSGGGGKASSSAVVQPTARYGAQQRGGPGGGQPIGQSQATSAMNSMDSLMTNRSVDSIRYRNYKGASTMGAAVKKSPTTTFGDLQSASRRQSAEPERHNGETTPTPKQMSQSQYGRSDTMPNSSGKAGIRLELEEKRRKYDTQRVNLMNQISEARERRAKDAFFTLLGKQPSAVEKMISPTASEAVVRKPRAVSETIPAPTADDTLSKGTSSEARALQEINQNMEMLRKQIQRLSTDQERLNQIVETESVQRQSQQNLSHAISQPSVYQLHHQQSDGQGGYAAPMLFNNNYDKGPLGADGGYGQTLPIGRQSFIGGAGGSSVPHTPMHQPPTSFTLPHDLQQQPNNTFRLSAAASVPPTTLVDGSSTFRLHQTTEPPSRLDPPLELNRNLTNWGMTYQAGAAARPQRKTWGNQTFVKSEMNLMYPPESQPPATAASISQPPPVTPPHGAKPSSLGSPSIAEEMPIVPVHQQAASQEPGPANAAPPPISPQPTKARSAEPPSPAAGFVVGDSSEAGSMSWDMEQKRESLLAAAMRRREALEKRKADDERNAADKRLAEQNRQEQQDAKKAEREAKRQKVFEEYQRKKALEQDGGDDTSINTGSSASPSNSARDRVVRGKSQPPVRPKSQVVHSASMRSGGVGGGVGGTSQQQSGRMAAAGGSMERVNNQTVTMSSISAASLAEPSVKPFVKPKQKSNRNIIVNALQYSVFAGAVHDQAKRTVLDELAKSDSKHFLLMFRDQKCQYRGLYSWDEASDTAAKICGTGPKFASEAMMDTMFKYDSGGKQFSHIPTRHLSATIDGFALKDQFWQKPKIPFSGNGRK